MFCGWCCDGRTDLCDKAGERDPERNCSGWRNRQRQREVEKVEHKAQPPGRIFMAVVYIVVALVAYTFGGLAAMALTQNGSPWVTGLGGLAAVIGVFVWGRSRRREEGDGNG